MTPEQFKTLWETEEDKLSVFSAERLQTLGLNANTVQFLSVAGLPDSAAPFLDFVKGIGVEYNEMSKVTVVYPFLDDKYKNCVVIGSDGGGNPIVINIGRNDSILWLDHEDDFEPYYFNNSINSFAACLLATRQFISTIIMENGEDASLNCDFTDEQFEAYRQQLAGADPECIVQGFWKAELDTQLANREYYKENP